MHFGSINAAMHDLPNVMSKFLNLKVPFDDLIAMTTWHAAKALKRPQLGNLDVGAEADIAAFTIEKGQFGFLDSAGARYNGSQRITCELTLRNGSVAWDLNARAGRDWKKSPYKNK